MRNSDQPKSPEGRIASGRVTPAEEVADMNNMLETNTNPAHLPPVISSSMDKVPSTADSGSTPPSSPLSYTEYEEQDDEDEEEEDSGLMEVMIETLITGTKFRVRVSPFETVAGLKNLLWRTEGKLVKFIIFYCKLFYELTSLVVIKIQKMMHTRDVITDIQYTLFLNFGCGEKCLYCCFHKIQDRVKCQKVGYLVKVET